MSYRFLFIVGLIFSFSCEEQKKNSHSVSLKKENKKSIDVQSYQKIKNFSSGSGMAFYNNHFYLVGDDDPFLIKTNKEGEILQKWQLWDSSDVQDGRINKKVKPDFEAISLFPYKNDTLLLIFGSGSKSPKRDVIIAFHPRTETIDTLNGAAFFAWFKETKGLSNDEINLEGAAYHNENLYLLNRHNNTMYTFTKEGFTVFLENGLTDSLSGSQNHYVLPVFKNDTARFSGASYLKERSALLFSASIETTDNWQDDGKILGSFIGLIHLDSLANKNPFCEPVYLNDSTRFKGKIEAVHGIQKEEELSIFFITDDDDGTTGWGKLITK